MVGTRRVDDGHDRIAARGRMVRAEHDRLAVARDLHGATQRRGRHRLGVMAALHRRSGEPDPDPVSGRRHGVPRFGQLSERGIGEPVVVRSGDRGQHDGPGRPSGPRCEIGDRRVDALGADRDQVTDAQRPPDTARLVDRARAEEQFGVQAAAHREVAAQLLRRRQQPHDRPGRHRRRAARAERAPVDQHRCRCAGDGQRGCGGESSGEPAQQHLDRGDILGVADEPVGEPQAGPVGSAAGRYAPSGVTHPAEVLDGRRCGGDDLDQQDASGRREAHCRAGSEQRGG